MFCSFHHPVKAGRKGPGLTQHFMKTTALRNVYSNSLLKPPFFSGSLSDLVDVNDFNIGSLELGLDWPVCMTGACFTVDRRGVGLRVMPKG